MNININDFELVLSRQTCQTNLMLNYASENDLGTNLLHQVLLKVTIISKVSIISRLVYHLKVSIKFKFKS